MPFTKTPMSNDERQEKRRAAALAYYWNNRTAVRAKQNARDPEKRRADARARRTADPERYRAYGRKEQAIRREKQPWLAAFHSRRKHAEARDIPFTLTADWARNSYTGLCALTGIPFDIRKQGQAGNPGPRPHSISIDRISPMLGYIPDNCRFVLNAVNVMRGSGTDQQMLTIAQALVTKMSAS